MPIQLKPEKITLRRKLKGWSMNKLAMVTGLSPNTITELEKNARDPREETVKKVADALGLNLEDLYEVIPEAEEQTVEVV